MNFVVDGIVERFDPLSTEVIELAQSGTASRERHDACLKAIPAFASIEQRPASSPLTARRANGRVIAFSWNAERLKYDIASRAFIGAVAPDIVLLTEVDIGMARSGNRHTVRDLAEHMGAGYVYALEFAELGLGDSREMEWHKGQVNTFGYHGNAIVSRHTLHEPFVIRLDDGAHWFIGLETADQRRIGFRNAIAATLGVGDDAMVCVAAHFENRATPEARADQARRLIAALDERADDLPIVIGGDFNTSALPTDAHELERVFADPSHLEPLFAVFREAGFEWQASNLPEASCRTRPDGTPVAPFTKIDWFFTRGLEASDPATLPAIDAEGQAISDHEALRVTLVNPRLT
jgi:endonuclease/exonuclease/phosphatase family metal-dependent hydrolase